MTIASIAMYVCHAAVRSISLKNLTLLKEKAQKCKTVKTTYLLQMLLWSRENGLFWSLSRLYFLHFGLFLGHEQCKEFHFILKCFTAQHNYMLRADKTANVSKHTLYIKKS